MDHQRDVPHLTNPVKPHNHSWTMSRRRRPAEPVTNRIGTLRIQFSAITKCRICNSLDDPDALVPYCDLVHLGKQGSMCKQCETNWASQSVHPFTGARLDGGKRFQEYAKDCPRMDVKFLMGIDKDSRTPFQCSCKTFTITSPTPDKWDSLCQHVMMCTDGDWTLDEVRAFGLDLNKRYNTVLRELEMYKISYELKVDAERRSERELKGLLEAYDDIVDTMKRVKAYQTEQGRLIDQQLSVMTPAKRRRRTVARADLFDTTPSGAAAAQADTPTD